MFYIVTCLREILAKTILATALLVIVPCFATEMIVPNPPNFDVKSYILMDFHSGAIIAEKNADQPADPASLTKLMAAYLIYESLEKGDIKLEDEVKISEHAWKAEGSRMFIEVDSKVSVNNLLMGLVVQSGNDASVALAEHVAGSESAFIDAMNKKAPVLGMTSSNFTNAAGLPSPDHLMTSRDIALLSRALIRDFPEYYKMYSVKEFSYNNINQLNRNTLLWRDRNVDGLKTGYTETAKYCLAASATRDNMRLISVILGSNSVKSRSAQTTQLLDYGFRFFSTHRLYKAMQPMYEAQVWGGKAKKLQLGVQEDFYVTAPRGMKSKIEIESHVVEEVDAPVFKMQPLGLIKVSYKDSFNRQEPLVALSSIPQGNILRRTIDSFLKLF